MTIKSQSIDNVNTTKLHNVEIVAIIKRCEYCSEKESCQSLPDEELYDEASAKLFACALAWLLKAKVFEKYEEFLEYLNKTIGFILCDFVYVDYMEDNFVIKELIPHWRSPDIVVIDHTSRRVGFINLSLNVDINSSLKKLYNRINKLVKIIGAKKVLQASYKDCLKMLKLEK